MIRKIIYLCTTYLILIQVGCSDHVVDHVLSEGKLSITVDGVVGTDLQRQTKASLGQHGDHVNGFPRVSTNGSVSGFTTDVVAEHQPMGATPIGRTSTSNRRAIPSNMGLNRASTQPMQIGYTYRILLYNKATGQLWKTMQATAGTASSLDVVKGDTYLWYAYSYNNDQSIPEPANLINPSIETAIDKDFLYAKGEIAIPITPVNQQDNHHVAITFSHKVAQVQVKVDATVLAKFAQINSISVSFDQDNYLKSGVFNIRAEAVEQMQTVPTSTIFNTLSPTHIWEANYYTLDPEAVSTYKIVLDDLSVQFVDADPTVANRNLATYNGSANKPTFTYNFASPAVGQRLTGIANLWYTLSSRRILHISNNASYGYAMEQGPSWNFLNARENFGILPTSVVKMAPWTAGQGVWIGGNLNDDKTENWINYSSNSSGDNEIINKLNPSDPADKPDIVIMGYDVRYIRPNVATALIDYLDGNGIVILMMQGHTGSNNQAFFNNLFGVNNITFSSTGSGGAMYPIEGTDANDPILNGHFGDVRGKHWGEDAGTTLGAIDVPPSQVTIYSFGQAINRSSTPQRVTIFKHNTKNFFFIGDGGFVSYNGGNSSVICPFWYDPIAKVPLPKPYGNSGQGYISNSLRAYNSVVMGNIMVWAAKTAEFNGIKPWRYSAPPTP
ncbi:hypothetical protein [Sphingobacterium bambusae]|uniref:Fimbrillin family protein n=1 Tax=Sphingobacterium bambusae TaxID=662858 RepID=A0ABW6BAD3_9SPHI|nr:hypothetical protein [Sphingobacterium bambusae]WPL48764.1 hypothetical protein SCB77_22700 [Sphingobacterium bambusae]